VDVLTPVLPIVADATPPSSLFPAGGGAADALDAIPGPAPPKGGGGAGFMPGGIGIHQHLA